MRQPSGPLGRRWLILSLLVGFSTVSYVERINLSVAGPFIRDDLHVSDSALGWMFSAFLIGYTLAQVPAGALADRYGAHRVLTVAAAGWFALTVAMSQAVDLTRTASIGLAIAVLVLLRFALGVAEAPTYPAATRAIATWFPSRERARANAIIQSASFAGSAVTLPFMAAATAAWGWRNAMLFTALPALLIGLLWWGLGSDRSVRDTPPTKSAGAVEDLGRSSKLGAAGRRDIGFLSVSYFFHGYVGYLFFFWFYSYLVEARGFSIADGGWVAALPTAAAAFAALWGGWASDYLAERIGALNGRRLIILLNAIVGASALLLGAFASSPAIAVAGFVLAIATRGFVEASYWTLAIELGGNRAGLVSGLMNAFCNIGGALSTAAAPFLVRALGWPNAFAIAAGATAASGLFALVLGQGRRATAAGACAG